MQVNGEPLEHKSAASVTSITKKTQILSNIFKHYNKWKAKCVLKNACCLLSFMPEF